ncbi:MAG: hypothetical protein E7611_09030 [Ruminococcaceae bacterium]|nr:hypothetical protein [Oscillospiraceae bacterium]
MHSLAAIVLQVQIIFREKGGKVMPRKPKPKNTLSAGERAALYEAEMAEKRARMSANADKTESKDTKPDITSKATSEKPKIVLPKPQHATVKVDFSIPTGRIKPMHSVCNGPVSYGADLSSLFKEIGVPYVRFDETDTAISAYAIDISRIFRDIHADPRDSSSYDFSYSDRYVAAAANSGAKIILRLGESVDRMHSGKAVTIPEDLDLFVDVCANIVRHYNDYWADGYAYGIEHFEIWSIGDKPYGKDTERAFELYRRTAAAVKLIDSSLKVGGMCFGSSDQTVREFIKYCRRSRAPLDFLTVSSFDSDPKMAVERVRELVPLLHNLGFGETEIIIGAWNYIDKDALGGMSLERALTSSDPKLSESKRRVFEEQRGVRGAAYALSLMISLGEIREAGMACYYDAEPYISAWCALCDRFGNPEKPFYAFKAYGDIYRAGKQVWSVSEQTAGYAHTGIYAIAAEGKDALYVLISSFDGCGIVDLRLDAIPQNIYTADVFMLDGVKNMTLADSIPISGEKKRLLLNISQYGAALIKLY